MCKLYWNKGDQNSFALELEDFPVKICSCSEHIVSHALYKRHRLSLLELSPTPANIFWQNKTSTSSTVSRSHPTNMFKISVFFAFFILVLAAIATASQEGITRGPCNGRGRAAKRCRRLSMEDDSLNCKIVGCKRGVRRGFRCTCRPM